MSLIIIPCFKIRNIDAFVKLVLVITAIGYGLYLVFMYLTGNTDDPMFILALLFWVISLFGVYLAFSEK